MGKPSVTRCLGLGLLAAAAGASSCKCNEKQTPKEFCASDLDEPSAGFPVYVEDESAGKPHLMFQVCDSEAADLNGDGLLDFVAADHINAGFGYFMQDPGASSVSFAAGQTVPFVGGGNSAGIVVEDFNFDGMPDVANSDHPGIVTLRINGTPTGAAIGDVTFPTAGETNVDLGVTHGAGHGFAGVEGGLVAADINTDGKLDIATANLGLNAAMEATASILFNTTPDPVDDGMGNLIYAPAATFDPVQYVTLPGPAISITTADFDGDGDPDLATSNTAVSSVSVLVNTTTPGAMVASFDRVDLDIPDEGNSAGAGPTNPVAADFNNDGKPDIVTANWNVDTVTLFTNTTPSGGPVSFTPDPIVVKLCFNPLVARAGDLDGDGDQDLVIVPLDLRLAVAAGVIENRLASGSDVPDLGFVDVIDLPERMQPTTFWDWLSGESGGRSPDVWFTSTGNVADFDGDGVPDLALAVARGDFAIALQAQLSDTTDILKFVVPPIDQQIANAFLPDFTELIYLTQ